MIHLGYVLYGKHYLGYTYPTWLGWYHIPRISIRGRHQKMGWWQATYEQYVGDLKLKLEKQVPGPLKGVVNW